MREPRTAVAGVLASLIPRGRSATFIELTLETGETWSVHADLILEYRLSTGAHIDLETAQQLLDADDLIAAKAVAARQIAYRPRSIAEIRNTLSQRGFRPATIDAVVERFTELGYLNDAEFADRWIANRATMAPRAERLLRQELRQKGISSALADESLERANIDELESALSLARNRAGKMAGIDRDVARRRLASYLERRGYGYEIVRSVDRTIFADWAPKGDPEPDNLDEWQ